MSPASGRTIARRAAIATVALAAFSVSATAAEASSVALFNNPAYVDYDPADTGSEASNLEATFVANGDTVTPFQDTSAAGIRAATTGRNVLVIPEQEQQELLPDLDAGARKAIRDYVAAGGTLSVNGDIENSPSSAAQFLNGLFGYAITGGDVSYDGEPEVFSKQPSAAGGPFAGGPAVLDNNNGFYPVDTASLPAGAKVAYANADVGKTGLFSIRYGKGTIVFLGYDWYESNPPDPTGADGGWIGILGTVADIRPPAPVAPTPPVVVPPVVVPPSPAAPPPSFKVIGARGSKSGKQIILRIRVGAPGVVAGVGTHRDIRKTGTRASTTLNPGPNRLAYATNDGKRKPTAGTTTLRLRRTPGALEGGFRKRKLVIRVTTRYTPDGGATQYLKNKVRIRGIR